MKHTYLLFFCHEVNEEVATLKVKLELAANRRAILIGLDRRHLCIVVLFINLWFLPYGYGLHRVDATCKFVRFRGTSRQTLLSLGRARLAVPPYLLSFC